MTNNALITSNRKSNIEYKPDLGEKIGNIGLGLLRIGFGKTLTVEKISNSSDKIAFIEHIYSKSAKVAAVALFILAFPITILLAGIGLIGTSCSKSHGLILKLYGQSKKIIDETGLQRQGGNITVTPPKDDNTFPGQLQIPELRAILNSQKSSHLTVSEKDLAEDIGNVDGRRNLGSCISQPELFNEAVRELTRLYSKIHLSELVGFRPYTVEENGKKIGKIGLFHLEHIENSPKSYGLKTLVKIFPLHMDIIKEESGKLKIKFNEDTLEVSALEGKKNLRLGFADHLEWLKRKGVTAHNISPQPFQVSSRRAEEITALLEKELLKLNQGINDLFVVRGYQHKPQKNFLTENPEKMAKELAAKYSDKIIQCIKDFIEGEQKKQLGKLSNKDMSESQFLSLRSPIIDHAEQFHTGVRDSLQFHPKLTFTNEESGEERDVAVQLVRVIMDELVRGGEIFYFDPVYYTGGHKVCWIRY